MSWVYLVIAGVLEIIWVIGIKHWEAWKINFYLLLVVFSLLLSPIFLNLATRDIPMNVAYTIWCGIGVVGVFSYSAIVFNEAISATNCLFIAMILVGIVGLKLGSK